MRLDYNAITAWSAVAAALVAVVALILEGRRSRFGLGVDLALRLNDYFLSTEFQKARQRAATAMKGEVFDGAYDVFNFFELVGMFTRRGVLDKTAVWSMYGYWIYHYWHAGKGHISSRKPATWRDFAYLYRIIMGLTSESEVLMVFLQSRREKTSLDFSSGRQICQELMHRCH